MNNRRWYPVSRLAPEQIKASRHSVDPSMMFPLLGVQTETDLAIVSHHIAGRESSTQGRSRRADRLTETALRVVPWNHVLSLYRRRGLRKRTERKVSQPRMKHGWNTDKK